MIWKDILLENCEFIDSWICYRMIKYGRQFTIACFLVFTGKQRLQIVKIYNSYVKIKLLATIRVKEKNSVWKVVRKIEYIFWISWTTWCKPQRNHNSSYVGNLQACCYVATQKVTRYIQTASQENPSDCNCQPHYTIWRCFELKSKNVLQWLLFNTETECIICSDY